jgi:MFS family permease
MERAMTPEQTVSAAPADAAAAELSRWRVLALLSLAELLAISVWFTASALAPRLMEAWSLTAQQAGWLTTVVQLGFVAGTATAAVLNLADLVPARTYFAVSALLAAGVNLGLAAAPSYEVALLLRFLTGFFLAGVYPPAMKMIATWFRSARGLAIGTLVGALTLGKAAPYLMGGLEWASIEMVLAAGSASAVAGALLVAGGYRDGPYPFPRRPFDWGLVGVVARHRETRLAVGGYLGHMWELYAMWTLVALFIRDVLLRHGAQPGAALAGAGVVAFGAIAAGGAGSVAAGLWADRLGRERVTIVSLAMSGSCALVVGWLAAAPLWVLVPLVLVWGFAIVADSAQFSALVTEVAPGHGVGTALTLQTSLGFLLSAVSIWLTFRVSAAWGWGVAFSLLAVGPVLGIWQMSLLKRARSA